MDAIGPFTTELRRIGLGKMGRNLLPGLLLVFPSGQGIMPLAVIALQRQRVEHVARDPESCALLVGCAVPVLAREFK